MRLREKRAELLAGHVRDLEPRRQPAGPERLGRPHVPDAGDELLALERLPEEERRRSLQPGDHRVEVGRLREDVRPEPARDGVAQLEDGPVPLERLELGPAQDEPRRAEGPAPTRLHAPAALHPQVAPQREAALEAEQEVLADRLHALQPKPVEPLGDPEHLRSGVRRLHLEPLADERLQPAGDAVDAVALGHSRSLER